MFSTTIYCNIIIEIGPIFQLYPTLLALRSGKVLYCQVSGQRIDSHIQHLCRACYVICLLSEDRLRHSSGELIQKPIIPTNLSNLIWMGQISYMINVNTSFLHFDYVLLSLLI